MKNLSVRFDHIKPFFSALGNETRFEIVRLVSWKPQTVSEICEALNCKQTKISNDLKCLRECGYVHVEKRGNKRLYSINSTILPILSSITEALQKLTRTCSGCNVCCEEVQAGKGRKNNY